MTSHQTFITTAPDFASQGGWSSGYVLATGHGPGVVVGPGRSNPNIFAQVFSTHGGDQYRVVAKAASVDNVQAVASMQINWLGPVNNFLSVSSVDFPIGSKLTKLNAYVQAPRQARAGILYVVPAGRSDSAVRYTEMGVVRLDPIRDFIHYRHFGLTGIEWSISLFLLFTVAAIIRFYPKQVVVFLRGICNQSARFFPLFAIAACIVALFLLKGAYEQNYDAQYHQGMFEIVMHWNNFSLDLGGDPMMSFGLQPIGHPRLSPTYLLGNLVTGDIRIPTEAAFQSVVMLLLLARLACRSSARINEAFAIALVGVGYCFVPFLSADAITLDTTLGLLWQESAIAVLIAFSFFVEIGAHPRPLRLWPPLGLGLTILWCFVTLPEMIPFFTVTTLFLCAGAICAVASKRELIEKVAFSAAIVGCLLLLGVYSYVKNIFMYTPQMYYTTLYSQNFKALFFSNTSLLLSADRLGGAPLYVFFSLAAIGAVSALCNGNRTARRVVFASISLEILIHAASALNVLVRFVPLTFTYIEQMGIPIVAALAGVGIWTIAKIAVFGSMKVATAIVQTAQTMPIQRRS
jgi:hypothetical protein